ncbi:hypothetical protein PICST_31809 [Scheffersomyces stipitis CBS 6054]|uniref:Uncharacterized protein n=1 Tax=Scheffersomyces stipitis (strain ATCC 58785 / CBS 6054 / NBRC 10063 / NRRL Y-11545) TaxID=322104 RepID=A3LUL6_PICST|nr:hypothetical protein PICST_31809 [Scheffersomyces stipitis CBS 6054]ABN66257.2 hypothetical protein PICST_31809 [Scheffersomyces stipitis CBS 6054]
MAIESIINDPNNEVGKYIKDLKDEFKKELSIQSDKFNILMDMMKAQNSSGGPPSQINKLEDRYEAKKEAKKDAKFAVICFKDIVPLTRNIEAITKWEESFSKLFRKYRGLQKIWDEDLGIESEDFSIKNIEWKGAELKVFLDRLSKEIVSRIIDVNENVFTEMDDVDDETDLRSVYMFVKTYKMENLPHRVGQALTYLRYAGDFKTEIDRVEEGLSHSKKWTEGTTEEILNFIGKMAYYHVITVEKYFKNIESRDKYYQSLAWFYQEYKKNGSIPTIDDVLQRMKDQYHYKPQNSTDKRKIEDLINERIKYVQEKELARANGKRVESERLL